MSITPTFEELEECTFVGIRVQTKPENISQELAKILPSASLYSMMMIKGVNQYSGVCYSERSATTTSTSNKIL